MSDNKKVISKLLRYLCVGFIIIFSAMTIISSGDGGDDNGGDDGDNSDISGSNIAQILPKAYSFNYGLASDNPLTFTTAKDGTSISYILTSFSGTGTYRRSTQQSTVIYADIEMNTGDDLYGVIHIIVPSAIWTGIDHPTDGVFQITAEGYDYIEPNWHVRINPAIGGVDLYSSDQSISLTWQEFIEIADNPDATNNEIIASFAFQLWELSMKRLWYFFQTFDVIMENQDSLEDASSNKTGYTETCDQFPPTGGTSGRRQYMYIDANSGGDLDPGDTFKVIFNTSANGCWYNDSTDDIDTLAKGTIIMSGYVENVDNDELTSTGFESIEFVDFTETETTSHYQISTNSVTKTSGAFTIFITPAITSGG